MPPVPFFFTLAQAALSLWDHGEDALADATLALGPDGLRRIQDLAAVYRDPDVPLPVGQRITLGHVMALAAVTYVEGGLRPLARDRRRPAKDRPAHLVEAQAVASRTPGADLCRPGVPWSQR